MGDQSRRAERAHTQKKRKSGGCKGLDLEKIEKKELIGPRKINILAQRLSRAKPRRRPVKGSGNRKGNSLIAKKRPS